MLYKACWSMGHGKPSDAEVAISQSKLSVSEAAIQTGLDAIQIHGGMGYLEEVGIEALLRDSVPSTIYSGTSEMHRNIIAAKLGL
jgi:alkylation response protein AidB-like acyl-CoA dehydrogenase